MCVQCVKSKSVTNLAEATADPVIDLDPVVAVAVVDAAAPVPPVEREGGALIGRALADNDGVQEHVDETAPS